MSKMDHKQRKIKKREEKAKKIKTKHIEEQADGSHLSSEQKRSGRMHVYFFFAVVIAGAILIVLGSK